VVDDLRRGHTGYPNPLCNKGFRVRAAVPIGLEEEAVDLDHDRRAPGLVHRDRTGDAMALAQDLGGDLGLHHGHSGGLPRGGQAE
jgi:hypothetical protein